MEQQEIKDSWVKRFFRNLRNKYKLQVLNEETLEEKFSMRLSRLNVIITLGAITLFSIAFTIFIIAITPLKEYIPGYASVERVKQVYINKVKIDSLQRAIEIRDQYLDNIKKTILMGIIPQENDSLLFKKDKNIDYSNIPLKHSAIDSSLRKEWEEKENYSLVDYPGHRGESTIETLIFFPPVNGSLSGGFDIHLRHYGVDIVGKKDEPVKAVLDGIVVFSGWTFKTGNTAIIQHEMGLISVYKHNSTLLKNEGEFVKAGEPIAIIGNSGEESTGPHLHFELWYKGSPINPADYLVFN